MLLWTWVSSHVCLSSLSLCVYNSSHLVRILSRNRKRQFLVVSVPILRIFARSPIIYFYEPETKSHNDNKIVNVYGVLICANIQEVYNSLNSQNKIMRVAVFYQRRIEAQRGWVTSTVSHMALRHLASTRQTWDLTQESGCNVYALYCFFCSCFPRRLGKVVLSQLGMFPFPTKPGFHF